MKIHVCSSLFGTSWKGYGEIDPKSIARPLTLEEFCAPQRTDAMALSYSVPNEDAFPRLDTKALPVLIDNGQEPLMHWVLLDLDRPGSHAPWQSQEDARLALEDTIDSLPVGLIDSAGGYTTRAGIRLVWRLSEPVPVTKSKSLIMHVATRVAKATTLNVDPASYEWTRFMRLPRAKRDGKVLESVIDLEAIEDGDTLDPTQFGELAELAATTGGDWGDAPPEPADLSWEDWKHTADMPWAHLGRAVPPDAENSRYAMVRTALARIAARGNYKDPHVLSSFLWASVLATEGSTVDIAGLWSLATWVADRQAAIDAEPNTDTSEHPKETTALSNDEWEYVKPAFRGTLSAIFRRMRDGVALSSKKTLVLENTYRALRTIAEQTDLPADFMYRAVINSVRVQEQPLLPELWEKCKALVGERASAGDDNDAIRKVFCAKFPLTVASPTGGGQVYQLDTTTTPYQYVPTNDTTIEYDFRKYTRPGLPFDADYTKKTMRQIVAGYGGRVESLVYVSGQEGCRFDQDTATMSVGVHTLQCREAVYDPEVDAWLRLMGGNDVERFLDWLAAVTLTSTKTVCALYLDGGAGIGKSLLARGMSCLWGSAAANYNLVMNERFNTRMLDSPILFAEEGIVVDRNNMHSASQKFRTVITSTDHSIEMKNRAPFPLRAAMRVLVCANPTSEGLPFRESLGQEGVDAIVQRVMYIRAKDEAREFLHSIDITTKGALWAPVNNSPGVIAKHLLWLRNNRKVVQQPGQRFLVQGKVTPWHREFSARQGIKPGVLQVVYGLLKQHSKGVGGGALLMADNEAEEVWVTISTVKDNWDTMARTYQAKPSQVASALKQISTNYKTQRIAGSPRKAYCIPYAAFCDAAICEPEDLRLIGSRAT